MVRGSQNRKSQTTHNQGTPQTPLAKKPLTLSNDVPTSTATSSVARTVDHYKLIENSKRAFFSI